MVDPLLKKWVGVYTTVPRDRSKFRLSRVLGKAGENLSFGDLESNIEVEGY